MKQRTLLLPYLIFNFYFYMWYTTRGFVDAVVDSLTKRQATWSKTERFRSGEQQRTAEKPIS
jgi:fucose 4-O-acetylase-like acetyltransferase